MTVVANQSFGIANTLTVYEDLPAQDSGVYFLLRKLFEDTAGGYSDGDPFGGHACSQVGSLLDALDLQRSSRLRIDAHENPVDLGR